jgi:hypothetical protein
LLVATSSAAPVQTAIVDVCAPSAAAAGRGWRARLGFVVSGSSIAARLLTALAVVLLIVGLSAARAR